MLMLSGLVVFGVLVTSRVGRIGPSYIELYIKGNLVTSLL